MSDTWNEIQNFKNKHLSLREKLKRRKAEREGLVADLLDGGVGVAAPRLDSPGAPGVGVLVSSDSNGTAVPSPIAGGGGFASAADKLSSPALHSAVAASTAPAAVAAPDAAASGDPDVEANLYVILCDVRIPAPTKLLRNSIVKLMKGKKTVSLNVVDELLQKLAADNLVSLDATPEDEDVATSGKFRVVGTEQSKVVAMAGQIVGEEKLDKLRKRKRSQEEEEEEEDDEEKNSASSSSEKPPNKKTKKRGGDAGGGGGTDEKGGGGGGGGGKSGMKSSDEDSLDFLLSATSTKEKEKKEQSEDILYLLSKPTAKEQSLSEKFRSAGGSNIKDFCDYVTKEECRRQRRDGQLCHR